jgi:DNA primase small subunit
MMKASHLFPVQQAFMWLNQSHVPSKLWTHREFAFILPGDVYLRHQSFPIAEDLRKQLIHHNHTRFDIGPIYSGLGETKGKEKRPGIMYQSSANSYSTST